MTTESGGCFQKPEAPSAPERRTSERSKHGRSAGAYRASPTNPSARYIEIVAYPARRTFSAEYKRKILRDAETARETGGVGALLRCEGLYASHLIIGRHRAAVEAGKAVRTRGTRGTHAPTLSEGSLLELSVVGLPGSDPVSAATSQVFPTGSAPRSRSSPNESLDDPRRGTALRCVFTLARKAPLARGTSHLLPIHLREASTLTCSARSHGSS